ncbi:putative sugar-binding domain protein [Phycisphaerae bacterium RAS1]|nr:putative sugar-binding domain protein [Phycisphaerae bacterium RAS1]
MQPQGVIGRAYQLPSAFCESMAPPEFREFLRAQDIDAAPRLNEAIDAYLREAAGSDVFVLGVGAFKARTSGLMSYIAACLQEACRAVATRHDLDFQTHFDKYVNALADLDYCGDITYRVFKRRLVDGRTVADFVTQAQVLECLRTKQLPALFRGFLARIWCHVRSIPPDVLHAASQRRDRVVMIVASGKEKAEAVHALCSSGYGNVLVIDDELAQEILRLHKSTAH